MPLSQCMLQRNCERGSSPKGADDLFGLEHLGWYLSLMAEISSWRLECESGSKDGGMYRIEGEREKHRSSPPLGLLPKMTRLLDIS